MIVTKILIITVIVIITVKTVIWLINGIAWEKKKKKEGEGKKSKQTNKLNLVKKLVR